MTRFFLLFLLKVVAIVFITSCSSFSTKINSTKNLTQIPCKGSQSFYVPIEFDSNGEILYRDQIDNLRTMLMQDNGPLDVYIFIHGWDKTVTVANEDYQNFICPIAKAENNDSADSKSSLFVGLFWPSTAIPNQQDPTFLKPGTYYIVRARADELAITGFPRLLHALEKPTIKTNRKLRLHLVGHSFGGRILAAGMLSYLTDINNNPEPLLYYLEKLDIVLLLPAAPNDALETHKLYDQVKMQVDALPNHTKQSLEELSKENSEWTEYCLHPKMEGEIAERIGFFIRTFHCPFKLDDIQGKLIAKDKEIRAVESLRELSNHYPPLKIFTIYSNNDTVLKKLFPAGSTLDGDPVACALGGCGAKDDVKVVTLINAEVSKEDNKKIAEAKMLSVDATNVIEGHSDIENPSITKLIILLTK